eukprot:TRINITY_DN84601_c0_g1_i1.p1 TRINITY_DN84601_c0_g1~~TRINITY_DN84601_c0_g1_i1.p1  ORF type:complete len:660 (-),score=140.02 TRINITY_DN84601_c0_g1_i1:224-2203(-)
MESPAMLTPVTLASQLSVQPNAALLSRTGQRRQLGRRATTRIPTFELPACQQSSSSSGTPAAFGAALGSSALKAATFGVLLAAGLRRRLKDRSSKVVRRARAYRMPLPPNVDEIQTVPPWKVLMEAVKNCEPEDAVIPTWKLKPKLGIYSPTPQYQPLHYIERKPQWQKASFIKRKMKKYYNNMDKKRLEEAGHKPRFLPDPESRLNVASAAVLQGTGLFKGERGTWAYIRKMDTADLCAAIDTQRDIRLQVSSKEVMLNERPGWQVTALKQMKDRLKRVDIVLEVRDARIPWTSAHPDIPEWSRAKPRVIVLTKADLVPKAALEETIEAINNSVKDRGVPVIAVDAQRGCDEIEDLRYELMKAGAFVNRRRKRKGVNPRAVRTLILGMPNVGKSSIINRLSGRKVALKTGWAGSTKKMTWHRIGGFRNTELEFMDSPGLIPFGFGKRYTKEQQQKMCACRIFGDKIIDREQTAVDLAYTIGQLWKDHPNLVDKTVWRETKRIYRVDWQKALRLEEPFFPKFVPERNPEPFCGKMLNDFNRGFWGKIQLEAPPDYEKKVMGEDWNPVYYGGDRRANADGSVDRRFALVKGAKQGQLALNKDVIRRPTVSNWHYNRLFPSIKSTLAEPGFRRGYDFTREKEPVFVGWKKQPNDEGLFENW